jgi:hypothetical protein
MMARASGPANPRLEALLDERDHIRIRISILLDARSKDDARIEAQYDRLKDVQDRIDAFERNERSQSH